MCSSFNGGHLFRGLFGILVVGFITCVGLPAQRMGSAVRAQTPAVPLSADDVSWLFPPPTRFEDLEKLISMGDLAFPDPLDATKRDRVWPDAVFKRLLLRVAGPSGQVD